MTYNIKLQKVTTDVRLVKYTLESYSELFAKEIGPLDGDIGWHYSYDCLVAYLNDEIAGAIIFSHEEKQLTLTLVHGFVRPLYRRLGLYTKLWKELTEKAKGRGAIRIVSATHFDNEPMRTFWKKLGRKESFVMGTYSL